MLVAARGCADVGTCVGSRLLRVNISSPGPAERWQEVISEHRSDIMQSVVALKVRLLGHGNCLYSS